MKEIFPVLNFRLRAEFDLFQQLFGNFRVHFFSFQFLIFGSEDVDTFETTVNVDQDWPVHKEEAGNDHHECWRENFDRSPTLEWMKIFFKTIIEYVYVYLYYL